MKNVVILLAVLAAIWIAWRLRSRRTLLPCPAELDWPVEIENPIARATRSEQVVRQLAPRPGARVMDIGCGPGRVTIPLARTVGPNGEVIALDVQAGMLAKVAEKAKKEGIANIRLMQSDVRNEQVHDGSLDAAVMVMALGEIPEGGGIFPFVFSALKPGGCLLVAESIFDPHFVSRGRLRKIAQAAGFSERTYSGNVFGYSLTFGKPASGDDYLR
jgi:ubiquinone/menaquinone biosynthesis C-methylase UbiE